MDMMIDEMFLLYEEYFLLKRSLSSDIGDSLEDHLNWMNLNVPNLKSMENCIGKMKSICEGDMSLVDLYGELYISIQREEYEKCENLKNRILNFLQ